MPPGHYIFIKHPTGEPPYHSSGYYMIWKVGKHLGISLWYNRMLRLDWGDNGAAVFTIEYNSPKASYIFALHHFAYHRWRDSQPKHVHGDSTWSLGLKGGYVEWSSGNLTQYRAPWLRKVRTPHRTKWVPSRANWTLFLEKRDSNFGEKYKAFQASKEQQGTNKTSDEGNG